MLGAILCVLRRRARRPRRHTPPPPQRQRTCCSTHAGRAHNEPTKTKAALRVLFFGTDSFSAASLAALARAADAGGAPSRVASVEVCAARQKDLVSAVKRFAASHQLALHDYPPSTELMREKRFDLGVVASFGHLIPERIISAFPLGMINVHASLLPKYRGAAPIVHALLNGDEATGVTIMEISPHRFDVGRILSSSSLAIPPSATRAELTALLADAGAQLLMRALPDIEAAFDGSRPQDEAQVTLAPVVTKDMFEIDWSARTSRQVHDQWRALTGLGKLYSFWSATGRTVVRFEQPLQAGVVAALDLDAAHPDARPGRAVYARRQRVLAVKCRTGWVAFERFYYDRKKVMSPLDFFNGFVSKRTKEHLDFVSSATDR